MPKKTMIKNIDYHPETFTITFDVSNISLIKAEQIFRNPSLWWSELSTKSPTIEGNLQVSIKTKST